MRELLRLLADHAQILGVPECPVPVQLLKGREASALRKPNILMSDFSTYYHLTRNPNNLIESGANFFVVN